MVKHGETMSSNCFVPTHATLHGAVVFFGRRMFEEDKRVLAKMLEDKFSSSVAFAHAKS